MDQKIKDIQIRLRELGYGKIDIDGINGKDTIAAVKKFQYENKLEVDGKVGKDTLAKLFEPVKAPIPNVQLTKMRDKISIDRVAKLHPKVRKEVEDLIIKAEGQFPATVAIRVVQGLRTIAEQNALYAQGRTTPGPVVTNAVGGKSYHNYGVAIDFALLYDKDGNGTYEVLSWDLIMDFDQDKIKDWMEVVAIFKAAGWGWGGDWKSSKDNPHLEKSFGYSTSQLLAKVKSGDVDAQGYVNI